MQILEGSKPLEARFVGKYQIGEGDDPCWEWTGARYSKGYAQMRIVSPNGQSRTVRASHISVYLFKGITVRSKRGDCVCHKCDNPPCVNPDHLIVAKQWWNKHDSMQKGRARFPKGGPPKKLNADLVRQIRLSDGYHYEIANKFGISRPMVTMIKNKTSWAHLAD
mgnify:CR=1 FL=1